MTAQAADLHLSKAGPDVGWYQLDKHKASHQRGRSSHLQILRTSAFLGWRRSCRIRSASRLLSSSSSLLASPADLCGPFPPTAECPAYMNLPFVVDSHHGIAQNLCVRMACKHVKCNPQANLVLCLTLSEPYVCQTQQTASCWNGSEQALEQRLNSK